MVRDLDECVRDLIASIFRLAFCDYVGLAYSHDEPGPVKYIALNPELQSGAERFLTGAWAAHLGDQAGLEAKKVWRQAQRDLINRPAMAPIQLIATTEVVTPRLKEGELAA